MTATPKKPDGTCPSFGCRSPGNPFCFEHLKPYAEHVISELGMRDAEIAKAEAGKWRSIDTGGPVAQEFLRIVKFYGQPTISRVRCDLGLSHEATESYMHALHRAALVRTGKNKREGVVIWLPGQKKTKKKRRKAKA